MSPRLSHRTSALMWRRTMVMIPMSLVKRGQRPIHQCKRQGLILHRTHLPSVAKPMRHWRRNKHPSWAMQSSPIRSMSNKSWHSNTRRALSAVGSLLQPLRDVVAICSLHSVWKSVYAKRQAILWLRGPSALNHHLLIRLRVAKYFARGTSNLT